MNAVAIRAEGLRKRYGDHEVLQGVTLDVQAGEVVGLVGENGAGKSTLLELLAGVARPDEGRIVVRGAPVRWRRPRDAADAGIGFMPQEPSMVPGITVAENILLGREGAGMRFGLVRWRAMNRLADEALREIDPTIAPGAQTQSLSFQQRRRVAFARALAAGTRTPEAPVLLLDEPTSALDPDGVEALLRGIERLRARASIVFVSHRLDEVLRVCDRIVVMADGRCVAERAAAATTAQELQHLMAGRTLAVEMAYGRDRSHAPGRTCLELKQLTRIPGYADVDLAVRSGEVMGLTGATASGCHELGRTLSGIDAPQRGRMSIDGQTVVLRDPAHAVAHGIAYVPADRASEGVVGALSVAENLALADRTGWRIDRRRERAVAARWIERLRIATPSASTRVSELSGGNQQKVALAKWLAGPRPRVLVLDDPLRALDVRARRDVVDAIRAAALNGSAVLVIADALEELAAICDRVAVMRDGRIREDRSTSAATRALRVPVERAA